MNIHNELQISAQEFLNFVIFKIDNSKININVKFDENELDVKVVCRDFRRTTSHRAIRGNI